MIFITKKPEEIVVDVLLEFAGDHSKNLDPISIDTYKEKLRDIFARSASDESIDIILPGFPYKSANSKDKVLGKLPDLGEAIALEKLDKLRSTLSKKLKRPVCMIICSDGFAFNDLKNIPDNDVLAYRAELKIMTSEYPNIKIKGLDDFMPGASTEDKRTKLMEAYGTEIETLKATMMKDTSLKTLYNNLSIFAKKDLLRHEGESKKNFRSRCKETALHVVARSKAWAGLIAEHHPDAIRLSIHPYTDVSDKFPICLVDSIDGRWRTPWHNVPVITGVMPFNTTVKLTSRKDAEASEACLNYKEDRPWCYTSKETKVLEHAMKCVFI